MILLQREVDWLSRHREARELDLMSSINFLLDFVKYVGVKKGPFVGLPRCSANGEEAQSVW